MHNTLGLGARVMRLCILKRVPSRVKVEIRGRPNGWTDDDCSAAVFILLLLLL